jgi:hypothetical protein
MVSSCKIFVSLAKYKNNCKNILISKGKALVVKKQSVRLWQFSNAAGAISPQKQKQTRSDFVGTQTSFCLSKNTAEIASSLKIAMFLTNYFLTTKDCSAFFVFLWLS